MDSFLANDDGSSHPVESSWTQPLPETYQPPNGKHGRIVRIRRCWVPSTTSGPSDQLRLARYSLEAHLRDHSELDKANGLVKTPGTGLKPYLNEMAGLNNPATMLPPTLWIERNTEERALAGAFGKWPHSCSGVCFNFELDTLHITTHASPLLGIIPKIDLARLRSLILPLQTVDVTDPTEIEIADVPTEELHHAPPGLVLRDNRSKWEWLRGEIAQLLLNFCPQLQRLELKGVTSCDLWAENGDSRLSMASMGYHKSHGYPSGLVEHIETESMNFWDKPKALSSLGLGTSPRYCVVCAYAHPSYIGGIAPGHPVAEQILLKTISVQCGGVMVVYEGFGFDYCEYEQLRGLREKGSLVQLQNVLCSLRRSFLHASPACGICPVTLCI